MPRDFSEEKVGLWRAAGARFPPEVALPLHFEVKAEAEQEEEEENGL